MITNGYQFKKAVWKELEDACLIPDRSKYKSVRSSISAFGREELADLKEEIGESGWKILIRKLNTKYPKDDIIRILGFGNALTRYVIEPFRNDEETNNKVNKLGARSNLIVSLFDQMIDSGTKPKQVLSTKSLDKLLNRNTQKNSDFYRYFGFQSKWIMTTLIKSYLRGLGDLSQPSAQTNISKTILSSIQRMHESEIKTLTKNDLSTADLKRKAALPFVIMGLPIWLKDSQINNKAYFSHMRWLYRLGLFFGSIDDIIDLEEDISNNHPNQFKKLVNKDSLAESFIIATSKKIVSEGKIITNFWKKYTNHQNPQATDFNEQIFGTCIVSWFGGSKNYQTSY